MFSYCEVMVKDFLPNVRALVAHRLKAKGLSQSQISKMLGVTQPSISYYLDRNEDYFKDRIKGMGLDDASISMYTEMLANDVVSDVSKSVETLHAIWRELMAGGRICLLHERRYPTLRGCRVCTKFFAQVRFDSKKEAIIDSMKKAISSIESSPYFAAVIPEVSVNIAVSSSSAKEADDIATIPGRIVRVRNRAKATATPEFGIKGHLTKLLLELRKLNPEIRAVMNIKYDEKLESIVSTMNLAYKKTEHNSILGEDDVIRSIADSMKDQFMVPLIVFDEGGFGIEPMTYVLGKSLDEIVQVVLEIARRHVLS
ncbi:MAG: thiamine-phosphate synthase family protein [Nitrososphaeria archaeon]